jgi:PAS domain S-box-containing protein
MTGTPYVLLVEDNPITRKLVRVGMHHAQIDLGEAGDGATALALVKQRRPDLILMDLLLPDVDGFIVAQKMRQMAELRTVPILAFSGLLSQLDEKRVAESGFTDFVTKPIEPLKLVRIVRAHLPATDAAEPVPVATGPKRRIILADDDDVQRKLSVFRLTRLGYEVIDVGDGQAALEAARATRPDAIITDAMMPVLDGFGLCAAIRKDEALKDLPIVLCTSTYVDDADRELARLAGANQYIIRTPGLREMIGALEQVLAASAAAPPAAVVQGPEFERERANRTMVQLERQAAAAASARQQCAMLSAELSVLNAISEAITQDQDIDQVLRDILAACCDAGGVSIGALYLYGGDAPAKTIAVGGLADRHRAAVTQFADSLEPLSAEARARVVTRASGAPAERQWLETSGLESALVVPLQHKGDVLGALVMMSEMADLGIDDRLVFAEAVGHQVSVALALTQAFEDTATAARLAREHSTLLESVFSSISDPIVVVDESGRATTWNEAAHELVGADALQHQDAPHTGWSKDIGLFHTDKVTPFANDERPVQRARAGERVDRVAAFLTYPARPDGAWVSLGARPLRGVGGEIAGAVAVTRDVTAERQAQEQLMISDRMASIGMMAAGVGHEINNPLSAVVANLEMAAAEVVAVAGRLGRESLGDLPDEIGEALDAARRVRQIALDLKVFSGGQADANHAMNVEDVLDSSVRMAWSQVRGRARIVKKYGGVPPASGAESRLGQVFLNLIVNAAQAIPEGNAADNEIRLVTRVDEENRVVVDIEDTGTGIAPHVMRQLFTPFVTTKPSGIGTGLGLPICRRLVSAMGGSIWADSTPGAGATFHVALPRAHDAAEAAPAPQAPAADVDRARILVLDDEDMIGMILRRALKGHDVTVMSSARDALAGIVGGERYDAILCDLMMPEMTGIEFHAALTAQFPDQARALMFRTGGAFNPETAAFLSSVPNKQLEKPFDVARLRETINNHLRARREAA